MIYKYYLIVLSVLVIFVIFLLIGRREMYMRTVDFKMPTLSSAQGYLFALLLPVLSAAGATLMTEDITPFIAYFALSVIAVTPLLLASGVFSEKSWPAIIYGVGLATLWQSTLVTGHLWGWDIHYLHHVALKIVRSGTIALQQPAGHGSLVSMAWFASNIHQVTGLGLVAVFKWTFPIIAAGIPLTLYATGRRVFGQSKIAALAPIGFVFFYRFYKVIPGKQPAGQLLIASIVLIFLIPRVSQQRFGRLLPILLSFGLVIAHHSSAAVFILLSVGAITSVAIYSLVATFLNRPVSGQTPILLFTFLGVAWFVWYSRVLDGQILQSAVSAGMMSAAQLGEILGLTSTTGPSGASRTGGGYVALILEDPLLVASAFFTAAVVGLGVIGAAALVQQYHNRRVNPLIYIGIVVSAAGFLVGGIAASFGMGYDRVISYGLLILSPLVVFGALALSRVVELISAISVPPKAPISGVAVCLCLLFVFSSGLAYVPTGETPNYALGVNNDARWRTYAPDEVAASVWIDENVDQPLAVFGPPGLINQRDGLLLVERHPPDEITKISPNSTEPPEDCGVMYVSRRPWKNNQGSDGWFNPAESIYYNSSLIMQPLFYDSGHSHLYQCS